MQVPATLLEISVSVYLVIMLLRLPRLALVRLMSLLLLATIGLQTSEPVEALYKERGSAFSSATSDVAVAVRSRPATARIAVALQPSVLPVSPVLASADYSCDAEPVAVPDSTGPPAFAVVTGQPAPRAPPLA